MSFANYIEKYCYDHNLTKEALAKKAGVNVSALRRFLNQGDVRILTARKIAKAVEHEIAFIPNAKTVSSN